MSEGMKTKVGLSLEQEMIFSCDLGDMEVKDCYVDDTHKDEVDMLGPNPTRMLGLALKKRNLTLDDLKAEAELTIARNKKGFWRVKKIDVEIDIKISDPDTRKRADQCRKMFEEYCVVTQAVREGIDVEVNVNY